MDKINYWIHNPKFLREYLINGPYDKPVPLDIDADDYYKEEKFIKMRYTAVLTRYIIITIDQAWFIEHGKKHEILLKNYGRYEPGVGMAKDFKEKKTLTSANMINELAERISNYTGAEIDDKTLYSAIYGKASNKENLKRQGLRQMLQTMGAIPDESPVKRKGKIEELKLLYFLCFSKYRIPYDFEKLDNTSSKATKTYNRSIKWRTYFNNISSENISIPVHSSSDQNGRIMVYLKANVFSVNSASEFH